MHPKVRNNSAFGYSGAIVTIHHGIHAHMAMVHEDCANFLVSLLSFLFLLTIFFLLSFSQPPPGVCQNKNTPSHFHRQNNPLTRKVHEYSLSVLVPKP